MPLLKKSDMSVAIGVEILTIVGWRAKHAFVGGSPPGNLGPLRSHLLAFHAPYSKHNNGATPRCQTAEATRAAT